MHNAAVEDAHLKADEFVGCACDYKEGAAKKESTIPSGLWSVCYTGINFPCLLIGFLHPQALGFHGHDRLQYCVVTMPKTLSSSSFSSFSSSSSWMP